MISRAMFGQRHQVQAQRQVVAPVAGALIWLVAWIVTERYCRPVRTAIPLRGTVVQPSLRAATVPAGGVLLRAKGWGVEVAGRAVRLFDPWLSESIRCGFPEIPKPGRSRRRKGRRAGRGGRPYASEIRRARRLCEGVTSPTIGWTIVFCLRAGFLVAGFDFGFRVAG